MRQEQLSDALTLMADDILQETDTARRNRNRRPMLWIKWGAVAASVAMLTVVGFLSWWQPFGQQPEEIPVQSSEQTPQHTVGLPMLTVTTEFGVGGFEGKWAHDITDLVDANPWQADAKLTTLPVYRNVQPYGNTQITDAYSEKMRTTLLDTAGRLGIDTAQLDITRTTLGDGIKLETDQVWIETDQQLRTQVNFEPAIALPKEYNFSDYASYADTLKVAEYLKTEYKDLIGMEDPQINISGGDYDIDSRQSYSIEFYEGADTLEKQIVNYNLRRRVQFCCDDEDKLSLVWIDQPDLSERIADYPIITVEAARELLANGQYINNAPYELQEMDTVKKVDLIYRNSSFERYFMPYYRFYVELPEEKLKHGLKTYGFYYVPAVQGAYIENMPHGKGGVGGETASASTHTEISSTTATNSAVATASEAVTSTAASVIASKNSTSSWTLVFDASTGRFAGGLLGVIENLQNGVKDIPPEDRERYQTTQKKLFANVGKLGEEFEDMIYAYIEADTLHAEIGYAEKTANGINYQFKTNVGNFKKYLDLVFEKTDFQKIVFKKDCMYMVLEKYRDKDVTYTIYSKPVDIEKLDSSYQKGYMNAYSLYEERKD